MDSRLNAFADALRGHFGDIAEEIASQQAASATGAAADAWLAVLQALASSTVVDRDVAKRSDGDDQPQTAGTTL